MVIYRVLHQVECLGVLGYDGGPIIEIGGPIFLDKLRILEGSTSLREGSVLSPGILRAMFGPLPIFLGAI